MVSVTISLDEEQHARLNRFSWVNWSEVARESLLRKEKVNRALSELSELMKNSRFTDKDVLELSEKVKKGMYRRIKQRS